MKNILVAINFDDNDQKVLDKASKMAQAFSAKVWLVHIATPDPLFVGYDIGPQYIRDLRAAELRDEHRSIQDLAGELKKKGITSEGLLIQGSTVAMLIDETIKLKADLIIVGRSKRDAFYKKFRESISKGVLKKSKIPILVVPE